MNIHEYQAKNILSTYMIPIPKGIVILEQDMPYLSKIIDELDFHEIVIKAQVYSGGRGLAGGIKIAKSKNEAENIIINMMGSNLITKQNGPHGETIKAIYLEESTKIKQEIYLSYILDRQNHCISILHAKSGGVHIESNHEIEVLKINPNIGLQEFHFHIILNNLGLDYGHLRNLKHILLNLYKLMLEKDATQIEINPLIINELGDILALDAKLQFDENALYRNPDIKALSKETDINMQKAINANLNFIPMEGNIACIVNGAGLAMATNDIIQLYGKNNNSKTKQMPANFLDLGGAATKENILTAFEIVTSYKNVEKILVNIFGGIVKCDLIAEGLIESVKKLNIKIPIIARLEGTNSEIAKELLSKQKDINIQYATSFVKAIEKAIE